MSDYQQAFIEMMKHAIEMSYHKYGNAKKTYPELAQAHKCVEERLDLYEYGKPAKDIAPHNKDYLIDVANFAMLEAMFPSRRVQVSTANVFVDAPPDAASGWMADFSSRFVNTIFSRQPFFLTWRAVHEGDDLSRIRFCLNWYENEDGGAFALAIIVWLACREFFNPSFPDAFHDRNAAGANRSPGLAGGISYKELMEGENDGMSRPFDF